MKHFENKQILNDRDYILWVEVFVHFFPQFTIYLNKESGLKLLQLIPESLIGMANFIWV